MPELEQLISRPQVAKQLGVSLTTLDRMTSPRGDIEPVRIGRRVLFHPETIAAFVNHIDCFSRSDLEKAHTFLTKLTKRHHPVCRCPLCEARKSTETQPEHEPHKTVWVKEGGTGAFIDEGIAPLVRELWKAGIHTDNSCQENQPGMVWLGFTTGDDAKKFLDIVADNKEERPDGIYARAIRRWDSDRVTKKRWCWSVNLGDWSVSQVLNEDDEIEESFEGPTDSYFSISVRFPRGDCEELLARLVRHNAK